MESKIRDLVDQKLSNHTPFTDPEKWSVITSSLDILGDTFCSLNAYKNKKIEVLDVCALYIIHFGVMQLLYVQQDAIRSLSKALTDKEISFPGHIDHNIRFIRNESVGHPSGGRNKKYSQLIRQNMSYEEYEYLMYKNNDTEGVFTPVKPFDLIDRQFAWVKKELSQIESVLTKI